jgi:dephospho-CoA kinase
VLLIALTGGIGSGKSTVAGGLADRGALIIDADRVAREVVEPGGPAYPGVVERFGPGVVRGDGTLDRPALAAVVFADAEALAALNGLTHPVIGQVITERIAALEDTDHIVVLDVPLLRAATAGMGRVQGVIVVDVAEDIAVGRLVAHRGFSEDDAWARVSAQASREERRALADLVIDNSRDRAALDAEIDRAWAWVRQLEAGRQE